MALSCDSHKYLFECFKDFQNTPDSIIFEDDVFVMSSKFQKGGWLLLLQGDCIY